MRKRTFRLLLLSVMVAAFCVSGFVSAGNARKKGGTPGVAQSSYPPVRLISPQAGDILFVGQRLTVAWEREDPPGLDPSWCEQEIFMSVDGGENFQFRMTRELGFGVRSYEIVVPNLPSNKVILDVRYGCQDQVTFEQPNPIFEVPVRIVRDVNEQLEEINLQLSRTHAKPGDRVLVSWDSTVGDLAYYEVLTSFDRGAHFTSAGRTSKNSFSYRVPREKGLSGSIYFQVVAHKRDGGTVMSLLDITQRVIVGN